MNSGYPASLPRWPVPAAHRRRLEELGALKIVPLRLAGFGSVSMDWRDDGLKRSAVVAMLECLRWAADRAVPDVARVGA